MTRYALSILHANQMVQWSARDSRPSWTAGSSRC